MSLHLTPESLEITYEWWRALQPFKAWKLPSPDAIGFKITNHVDRYGHFNDGKPQGHTPHIAISALNVKDGLTLLATVAHEMCHMRQGQLGIKCADHGRVFKRIAAQVLKRHRWLNPETF